MKNNKIGFTMAEVLIAIMIVGIIMVLAINSFKAVRVSYTSLAYFAHRHITDMVGVLYGGTMSNTVRTVKTADASTHYHRSGKKFTAGEYTEQTIGSDALLYEDTFLPSAVTQCTNSKGKIVTVLKNDDELYSTTVSCSARDHNTPNSKLFCKSLVALSNNSGKHDCTNLYESQISMATGEPEIKDLVFNKPNLTLTNGMRVYLTKWEYDAGISVDYGYRLIGVDLNGKEKPNRVTSTVSKPTDFVTFLVLDNGEIYPLGVAADNLNFTKRTIQYINAKVKGYNYSHGKKQLNDAGSAYETVAFDRDNIPEECKNLPDGDKHKCNIGISYLDNSYVGSKGKGTTNFTYREAFCSVKKIVTITSTEDEEIYDYSGVEYADYCNDIGLQKNEKCPPTNSSSRYDSCRIETVKPAFRYSL